MVVSDGYILTRKIMVPSHGLNSDLLCIRQELTSMGYTRIQLFHKGYQREGCRDNVALQREGCCGEYGPAERRVHGQCGPAERRVLWRVWPCREKGAVESGPAERRVLGRVWHCREKGAVESMALQREGCNITMCTYGMPIWKQFKNER